MTSIEEPLQGGSEPLYFTKESTISANGTDEQTPHCNEMVKNILASLKDQSEIVIDFTSLKTCLNPMGLGDANTEEQLDYKNLLYDIFEKPAEMFPNLKKLSVLKLLKVNAPDSLKDDQYDYYIHLSHGIMQLSSLSELNLTNLPSALHSGLQFWNLHNLKKLAVTDSSLQSFPGSVGRLKQLEELDLSNNILTSLPITLEFCKNLKTLDLRRNSFKLLPSVVLKLKNLTTLRRLDNSLTQMYDYTGPHYTKTVSTTVECKVYQPLSLQANCTKVVFTSQIHYWDMDTIGQLQCKTLDRLAEQFTVCDNCNKMLSANQPSTLELQVFLVTHVELRGVPFLIHACNQKCLDKLAVTYGKKNEELQKELDAQYKENILVALEQFKEGSVEIETKSYRYDPPSWTNTRHTSRRRKKCSIM